MEKEKKKGGKKIYRATLFRDFVVQLAIVSYCRNSEARCKRQTGDRSRRYAYDEDRAEEEDESVHVRTVDA